MKSINLTFIIHHPVQLRRYRFFDIGNNSYYYDDFENERKIRQVVEDYYLPNNEILINLIKESKGQFKVNFSVSGTALDLFELYAPEMIESLQRLCSTGYVEFLGETYAHSLVSLTNSEEFRRQAEAHSGKIKELFGRKPEVFINTGLIYSDSIGEMIADAGFKAVLTEGARHILKWRSPNYLYSNPLNSDPILLLNNNTLSGNLAFRFSNPGWTGSPSDGYNYISALNRMPEGEEIVNLCFNYETVRNGQRKGKGRYNFLRLFPASVLEMTGFGFMNPSEMISNYKPVAELNVTEIISAEPFERGNKLYLGNDLQNEAFDKLYETKERIHHSPDGDLLKDWLYLQTSDHFRYMDADKNANAGLAGNENPYDNFYEAFMNYMNVLCDFKLRVNKSLTTIKTDFAAKNLISRMAG